MPIIIALIGLVGTVTAALIANYFGVSWKTPPSSPSPSPVVSITPLTADGRSTPRPPNVRPDKLLEIIKQQQRLHVKESYGELANQCFTENDLRKFVSDRQATQIADELKRSNELLDIVQAVKAMAPTDRQNLLEAGLHTYKPTWEQLGKVDRQGQTVAGQNAEKMIAEAIVNLVKNLSKLSDDDLKKLYT